MNHPPEAPIHSRSDVTAAAELHEASLRSWEGKGWIVPAGLADGAPEPVRVRGPGSPALIYSPVDALTVVVASALMREAGASRVNALGIAHKCRGLLSAAWTDGGGLDDLLLIFRPLGDAQPGHPDAATRVVVHTLTRDELPAAAADPERGMLRGGFGFGVLDLGGVLRPAVAALRTLADDNAALAKGPAA